MKTVQVLMSSYNGEKYIKEQIESVLNQQGVNVQLLIRDDGSKDQTLSILGEYSLLDNVHIIKGENVGAGRSFAILIDKSGQYDYYALCDQDDFWEKNKLISAVKKLEEYKNFPCIYSSNTIVTDEKLVNIYSENKKPLVTLGSAIIKNYVTGCTAVFNDKLRDKLVGKIPEDIVCHDWWINLVCLSVGGQSIFDDRAFIKYRQHGRNVTGAGINVIQRWNNRFKRFKSMQYNRDYMASRLLETYGDNISEEKKTLLTEISFYKKWPFRVVLDKNIRTKKLVDDILFHISVLYGKI